MSWSFTRTIAPTTTPAALVLTAEEQALVEGQNAGSSAPAQAALDAAITLIDTGCFGDPEEKAFSVSMSGHVNPDYEPRAGFANDCVSISVVQKS